MTTKRKEQLKKITGQTTFDYVSPGTSAESTGFVLSDDSLEALLSAAEESEGLRTQLETANTNLEAATTARTAAETSLANANATIATNTTRIAELEARVAELEEGAPEFEEKPSSKRKVKGKVPAHESDDDPFNAVADSMFGKPVDTEEE